MCQNGILNLLKPAGMTSHDAVSLLRRLTGIKRIGHTGTLDPMAVGVLPICIGKATRIIEYMDMDLKSYRCEMQLGLVTDTLDVWGKADLGKSLNREELLEKMPSEKELNVIIESLKGEILQYPPKYSALKVDGKRLYEYARQNLDVEIKPRIVNIKEISLIRYDKVNGIITFDTTCSKGTYIRSLCKEIGEKLGTGAAMTALIRTSSGVFKLSDTVSVEKLEVCGIEKENFFENAKSYIYPIDSPLVYLGKVTVNQNRGEWFLNGGYLTDKDYKFEKKTEFKNKYAVYHEFGKFLGIAELDTENTLNAEKVIGRFV